MKTFEKVIPILKRNKLRIFVGLFLLIIIDLLQLYVPKIMQKAIDSLNIPGITPSFLIKPALLIVAIAVSIALIRFIWRILLIGNAWITDREIRQMYYEHLLLLSKNFFNKAKTGDLMAYAINDLNAVRMLIGFGFVILVDIVVFAIGAIIFMIKIDLKLTLLAIIPLPLLTLVIIVFGKKIHHHFRRVQKAFATLSGKVQESISGIRVVKAFVQEEAELEKVSQSAYEYVKENLSLVKIFGMFHPFLFLIISLSMGMVLLFGGKFAMTNQISMGEFVAFFSYLGMFVWPAIAVGWFVNLYQRGTASLKRINSIFEIEPEIVDENPDYSIKELKGNIEVKNLSFRYPPRDKEQKEENPLILNDISFSLEAGKTLAIVGKTGCGKTTIIDLITRIYNPPKNHIFIDGYEIYQIPLKTLRENIVTVPQEIFLFSDSIANNISLGKPDVDRKIIEDIAGKAQIYDDIIDFENGFDTIIGERGVTLSGGQKQRLAIARALLTDPNILILDDALSSVDTKTERQILQHLAEIRKNKTTIIIAHRISSIQHADKIIVIENGKVAESGNHSELLKKGKIYRNLYEKQQIEEKLK